MTDFPIPSPPPELVQQWLEDSPEDDEVAELVAWFRTAAAEGDMDSPLLTRAADLLERVARRPKPPSLKEQALDRCNDYIDPDGIIRRALEQLDD